MNRLLIGLVKAYQLVVSPLLGGRCRYVPTCSSYMIESIETNGWARGLWMGLRRLARCHPFGGHGLDPVKKYGR